MRRGRYNPGMRRIFPALAVMALLLVSGGLFHEGAGPRAEDGFDISSTDVDTAGPETAAADAAGTTSENSPAIHPSFDFTAEDFPIRLPDAPPDVLTCPRRFLELASEMIALPEGYLMPVGPDRPLSADNGPATPVPLETLPGSPTAKGRQVLDAPVAEELVRLAEAAAQDGVDLMIASAYRSWEYQKIVFDRHVELFGEESAAGKSRPPGTSQHQLGTSVDFGYADVSVQGFDPDDWRLWRLIAPGDPAEVWLAVHAGDFGWSLSYPPESAGNGGIISEPWHWRWIGSEAVRMQNEFFGGDQRALLKFWDANADEIESARACGTGRKGLRPPQSSERTS